MPPVILDTDFLPLEELAKRLGIPMKRALELQQLAEEISGLKRGAPGESIAPKKRKSLLPRTSKRASQKKLAVECGTRNQQVPSTGE